MARPRLVLDEEKIRELLRRGCGSRRIARELNVSRSVIQRAISGRRFAASRRRATADPTSTRSASDRKHAHDMLAIGRGHATDEEFAAAAKKLDALLDERPEARGYSLSCEVKSELDGVVRKREDDARRAKEERERWMKDGAEDAAERWRDEVRLAARGLGDVEFFERQKIQNALDEEGERVVTLVARRMKEMKTGAITEGLVDGLVEEGLARVEHVLEKLR